MINLNKSKFNKFQKKENLKEIKESRSVRDIKTAKHKSLFISQPQNSLYQNYNQKKFIKKLKNLSKNLLNLKTSLEDDRNEMKRSRSEIMTKCKETSKSRADRHFVVYGRFVCKDANCPYNCSNSLYNFTKNYVPYSSRR